MSLDELASLGEFIGGIGVLVTLVFVAVQLRQNTRAIQRSNAREAGNALVATMHANNTPVLTDIFVRGSQDLASLSPTERVQFDNIIFTWLHGFEQEHFASRESPYLEELLAPKRRVIAANLSTPGGSQWWSERRLWFTDYFVGVVEELLATPPEGAASASSVPETTELQR
jgi:hypothetical protein